MQHLGCHRHLRRRGTCIIDANQAGNASYQAATQVQQSFAVVGTQSVTFTSTPPNPAVVEGTYTPTATGGASGNPVTFSVDPSANGSCSISGATVTLVAIGTCVIDANQAGNANYQAATQVQQSFAIATTSSGDPWPDTPAATGAAMCGSSTLQSPYSYAGAVGGPYTRTQWASMISGGDSLPPLTPYPWVTSAAIINSSNWGALLGYSATKADTLYYIEPGNQGAQGLGPFTGDVFIGGYDSASGEATMTGNNDAIQYGAIDTNPNFQNPTYFSTTLSSAASVGNTTITTVGNPLQWTGISFPDGTIYRVTAVSGSGPYTLTLDHPIETAESSGATATNESAGNVHVEYLTMENYYGSAIDVQDFRAPSWVVEYDTLTGNTNAPGGNPSGTGFYGAGTVTHNCISANGEQGVNMFGTGDVVTYNEFTGNSTHIDNGCGCDSALHGWLTTNLTASNNYFYADVGADAIWLDTGNTGYLVSYNYVAMEPSGIMAVEISYNGRITDNNFVDNGWSNQRVQYPGLFINNSGGADIAGSNYNDSISVDHNNFSDDWKGVEEYGENDRSCIHSGSVLNYPTPGTSYCTNFDPASFNAQTYGSSSVGYSNVFATGSSGSSTIKTTNEFAAGDQVGFAIPAQVTYGGSTISNLQTAFTGSQNLAMPSVTGFTIPGGFSSLQVEVETSGGYAILSYTGTSTSPNELTGVSFVRGATGTLSSSEHITAVPPYKVTAVSGVSDGRYGVSFTGVYTETITPALTTTETAGTPVSSAGTCLLYDVAGATPTTPTPSSLGFGTSTISYYDGCKWNTRNVSVTGNTFNFTPGDISGASNPPWVGQTGWPSSSGTAVAFTFTPSDCNVTGSWLDYVDAPPTGNSFGCGVNEDYYQTNPGSGGAAPGPYAVAGKAAIGPANAQMSVSSFTAPLNDLNLGSGDAPGNNAWSGDTYTSDISFWTYLQVNGLTSPYHCGSVIDGFQPVCIVNPSQWSSIWQQG